MAAARITRGKKVERRKGPLKLMNLSFSQTGSLL